MVVYVVVLCFLESVMVSPYAVVILGYKMLTSDFSSSDLFIDLVNIMLFCWQAHNYVEVA